MKATNNYECAGGDCNNLVLTAPGVGGTNGLPGSTFELISEAPKPAAAQMVLDLAASSTIYIAHVRNKSHFVLLTEAADPGGTAFYVNDPYYNVAKYTYSDISDVIMYRIIKHTEPVTNATDPVICLRLFVSVYLCVPVPVSLCVSLSLHARLY